MKYVIIGNSAAAVGAVEAIRQNDTEGKILIISDESYHTYSRPLISYLLLGKTTREKMKYRSDSFYSENNCEVMLSTSVTAIDKDAKCVLLSNGESESYDKLLVATGSSPFVPPVNGLDKVEKKFTFISLDDANALEKAVTEGSKVLIVGAGLIGLKCAEGISAKADITCVDLSDRVLSSILDDGGSEIVKAHLEDNGIKFRLGVQVSEFGKNSALLSDGTKVEFDVLVMAVGVRPNTALVKNIGGEVGRGIVINERCATSVEDIYAAGDCCESMDVSTGEKKVMALLPNAYMQGECAGMNMSGADFVFDKAIPMNAIGFFGKHIITAGSYTGEVYTECEDGNYKKLFYGDNKLNGFILIGNAEKAGIYTSLVRERTKLDTIDFELICEKPGLMAFSKDVRAEKLGSAQ
ncbi:MAG: FAD-dependent oxidoreductase [Oscillospiraceae bacterium]|nr:FAD-dependent oxidoreductase [Oscillospiraceae bacterium]